MDSNQTTNITLSKASTPVPILQAYKEVPQIGISSKGQWDVNANATNYDFYDEKPISYSSVNLTPSATGDGTFVSSNPISHRHIPASTAATTYTTYGAGFSGGQFSLNNYYWGSALLSDDGTKFWMVRNYEGSNSDEAHIYAWTLSTPFRVDTAAAVGSAAVKVITEMTNISTMLFNNNGTKIVCANGSNFYQFDLSTAYDLSTMGSGTESNWRIDLQRDPLYIDWSGDGTKLITTEAWTSGGNSTRVRVFDLNTSYDITTMANLPVGTTTSFDANNPYYSISSANIYQKGWKISQDGLKFYAIDNTNGKTLTKELPSAWVMKTGTVTTGNQGGLGDGNNWLTAAGDDYVLITGNYSKVSWTQNGSAIILFNGAGAPNYLDIIPLPAFAFNTADVGKKVVGNSGSAIITATSGAYQSVTAFADTSAISSWTLTSSQGKADGSGIQLSGYSTQSDIVFPTGASGSGASMVYNNNVSPTSSVFDNLRSVVFNSEGTIALVLKAGKVLRFNLSTAFDLSTMTEASSDNFTAQLNSNQFGIVVKPDGTRIWVSDHGSDLIKQFTLSTPWSPSTQSYDGYYYFNNGGNWNSFSGADGVPSTTNFNPFSFQFNSDGTKMITIMWDNNPYHSIVEFALSTGWDMSTMSYTSFANFDGNSDPEAIAISPDGLKLMMHGSGLGDGGIEVYSLPSAFSVGNSGNSLTKTSGAMSLSTLTGNSSNNITYGGLSMSSDGKRMWVIYNNNGGANPIYEITGGTSAVHPYSTYSPALTNSSSGQINSSSWLDINSMTADETKNNGDIFYAVSTDNRTSWDVAKGSDGVRKIAKNNSGTWQYNNNGGSAVGYDIASASYANVYFSPTSQTLDPRGIAFNSDGTKLYVASAAIWQYSLSSAYDISNPTYENKTFSFSSQDGAPSGIQFNNDGTKLYMSGASNHKVFQYSLSSAYDVSTASYDSKSLSSSSVLYGFTFNNNGTKIYLARTNATITEHSLSTAYDVSTAGSGTVFNLQSGTSAAGIAFNSDGTKLFVVDNDTGYGVYQYNLSTAYDISTASYASLSLSTQSENTNPRQIVFNNNGSKLFVAAANDWTIDQYTTTAVNYSTSETWVNGTNNNEHATLQEALGAQSFNRMNKAQLDAVADGYHFSQDSANTLDLMIAPYAASGTSPISDGVTINYDAESKYRQAVPETDYRANFAGTSTVEFTSIISANFKVKVV
jgi:DNA-binding beta-propeller fold protein YncE